MADRTAGQLQICRGTNARQGSVGKPDKQLCKSNLPKVGFFEQDSIFFVTAKGVAGMLWNHGSSLGECQI